MIIQVRMLNSILKGMNEPRIGAQMMIKRRLLVNETSLGRRRFWRRLRQLWRRACQLWRRAIPHVLMLWCGDGCGSRRRKGLDQTGADGGSSRDRGRSMPSIRELRDHKQRESFTGRQAELGTFRELLEAEPPEYSLLHIYGVGGIGKSSLLRQYRRLGQELDVPSALVDMQVHFGVVEVLRSIREQIGEDRQLFLEFDRALDLYNDVKSKLQEAVGSLASGVVSGLREGVPLGLGALAVDAIGEEQVKSWLYRHLPRANADLYLNGDRLLTEKLVTGLNRRAAEGGAEKRQRLVLMLDTYEQASEAQDAWLRDVLLDGELSSDALIVIAGRDPLGGRWHEWRSVLLSRELHPFSEEEARAYLARRGISDPAQVEAWLTFTERLPWALALATDAPHSEGLSVAERNPYVIGDKLVDRFLSQVHDDAEMRELVEACTVVRTFDDDVVRAIWGREAVAAPMERLRRYSFVLVRADGRWSLNQVVREFLDGGLRRRSPERWTELNRRAAEFYDARAGAWPRYSREWNWYTLECLYHRLRLDEQAGMLFLATLFEEAKRVYRHDLCSELLNNVQDVKLTRADSAHWLEFYRCLVVWMTSPFAWEQIRATDLALYEKPDLPLPLRARVTADLGRYYYLVGGEPERAIAMLEESLRLRRELADEASEAQVLSHLAVAHAEAGHVADGRRCAEACIALAERLGAPYRQGWGHYGLAVVERSGGDLDAALARFLRAREIFEAAGHEFGAGVVDYQLGRLAFARGDLAGALAAQEAHLRLMLRYDKPTLAARALVEICEILLRQGDDEHLARRVAEAERLILAQQNHALLARLRLVQAAIVLRATPAAEGAEEASLVETLTRLLREAFVAGSTAPRSSLQLTLEQIEEQLAEVQGERPLLAQQVRQQLLTAVDGVSAIEELDLRRRWSPST
jgi:tetratricopeptide (TPR) repeat protein